ncbi:MAG: hypothetical protein A2Z20_06440 [Bdellovibrionales bacterium RBG_16_40_8]|nr:MAG: hypothetical protein A2Z20_06440 [Bdellovibrionales bacterium RBG_16_40_8]
MKSNSKQHFSKVVLTSAIIGPLLVSFFYNFSQFALVPYFGYLNENNAGLISAGMVGIALTAKSLAEKLSLFGISITRWQIPTRLTLFIGLVLRAFAFLAIQYLLSGWTLLLAVPMIGFAGSLIRPTVRAILNEHATNEFKEQIFSVMFLVSNLGAIFGPLVISLSIFSSRLGYLLYFLASIDLFLAVATYIFTDNKTAVGAASVAEALPSGFVYKIKTIYSAKKSINYIFAIQALFWVLVSFCIMLVSFLNKVNPEFSSMRGYIFAIEGSSANICGTIVSLEYFINLLKPACKITERDIQIIISSSSGKTFFEIAINRDVVRSEFNVIEDLFNQDSLLKEILSEPQCGGMKITLVNPVDFLISEKTGKKVLFHSVGEQG